MKSIGLLLFSCLIITATAWGQDDLINKLKDNKTEGSKEAYVFTPVLNVEATSVKNQGSSGTCWSYSSNSFLESEMIRMGKKPVDLADIYTARCSYIDKADMYVRMNGAVTLGDGGEAHDVINMLRKYGALPQEAYEGLNYGTSKNKFGEMQAMVKAMLEALIKNPNGQLTPVWKKAITATIDTYLGEVPKEFTYNGKKYTPMTFSKEVVGINADDYVEVLNYNDKPLYQKTMMIVPDNWALQDAYNVSMDDLTSIVDNALKTGYSIVWATDVSEKYFSWKNGVAYVPVKEFADMSDDEKKTMFEGPKPERSITKEMRQEAFDNYTTTDDHGMQITGIATDQNGREYYIVKNSWGESNDYKGYLYVSKNFVKYKTTALLLHKDGLPKDIKSKLGLKS